METTYRLELTAIQVRDLRKVVGEAAMSAIYEGLELRRGGSSRKKKVPGMEAYAGRLLAILDMLDLARAATGEEARCG